MIPMNEKVKLTREQAEIIEDMKKTEVSFENAMRCHLSGWRLPRRTALSDLSAEDFANAFLNDNYEVEEEFKPGETVVKVNGETFSNGSKFATVNCVIEGRKVWLKETKTHLSSSKIRRITPKEKEEIIWAKIGREPGELKVNDVFINGYSVPVVIRDWNINDAQKCYERGKLKGFFPAESFIEFGGGEE